ncbi:MAG: transporter, monovalent cation:proton antiporter-2 family [Rhodocyclaceae bacterium]|nr:transporter, monovalent cation:proton antiporter-2 family [Rhodocyclaceae bacterium]
MPVTLQSLVLLLCAAVLAVALARQLRLPPILAYLAVGVAIGPHGLRYVAETEQSSNIAEFGVVFLMFSIGLEFSLARLRAMRRLVFGFGGAQVLVTLAGTTAVTVFYYGQDWRVGFAVGAACAMSSTAIVSRLLSERLELHSQPGRQTMAVLLFQDLAVVPLLIVIPALAGKAEGLAQNLLIAFAQATLVLTILIMGGQRIMRRWFDLVARQKSTELFMLNVLLVVVGLSWLTSSAGLSLALGAFVGGMLIAETVYRHQVEADVRPFRDVLLGLFFVTVGMLLDVDYVFHNLPAVLAALALLVLAKGGIVMILTLVMKNSVDVGLRTAVQLAQAGEFGFVLLQLAGDGGLIPRDVFQVTMAAMLLSMMAAPFLIARAAGLGKRLSKGEFASRAEVAHQVAVHSMGMSDHVILCGFGRTGQSLAHFLERESIPFIALDIDSTRVQEAGGAGENVVFGTADRREVLTAAGVARARAVVITFADPPAAERTLEMVRALRPDLPVIVRAQDESQIDRLKSLGASEVVPEVLEGSLMLAAQTLAQVGVPLERSLAQVRSARAERYASLRAFYRGESDRMHKLSQEKLVLVLEPQAYGIGKTLAELDVASRGVMVEALRRRGVRSLGPEPETRLEDNDVLILVGAPENLADAEHFLLDGRRSVRR